MVAKCTFCCSGKVKSIKLLPNRSLECSENIFKVNRQNNQTIKAVEIRRGN